jgi:uncharacterized protein YeeX (DUF496 family)
MKVRAEQFATDLSKVDWSKVPASMKQDGEQLKAVAPFYAEGGDFKAGIDNYVAALNAQLSKAKPKAAKKAKAEAKKATGSKSGRHQSKADAATAKEAYHADKRKAEAGEFAKMSRNQVLEIAQRVHKNRRLAAQVVDEAVDHKKRLTPTPENLVRWMKEPGKYDLIGIDTFEKNNPTADLKIKKEIFWARLLKK